MIDIHTHFLPEIDDGPSRLEQSLEMLEVAEKDGITDIVATPHIFGILEKPQVEQIYKKFAEVQKAVQDKGWKIKLHLTVESFINPAFQTLLEFSLGSYSGNKKYSLVEFSMTDLPFGYESILVNMKRLGLIPIIAHPERNSKVYSDLQYAYNMVDCGALLQVTAGSFYGKFGQKPERIAWKMLEDDLVFVVASDAHDAYARPPLLSKAYNLITRNSDKGTAKLLFIDNPLSVIE
jgi:protein-tyrosine phosphatase